MVYLYHRERTLCPFSMLVLGRTFIRSLAQLCGPIGCLGNLVILYLHYCKDLLSFIEKGIVTPPSFKGTGL